MTRIAVNDNYPEFVASLPASWYSSSWSQLQHLITEENRWAGKAYKSGLEKEGHLGKMTRTDTLKGSGECRVKRSSLAEPAGSELPGESYTHLFFIAMGVIVCPYLKRKMVFNEGSTVT